MPQDMELKLTLRNANATAPLHLTSLAPQDGWQSAPPHHLPGGQQAECTIKTAGELAITLRYGAHHIGLHLGNGKLNIEPGDASVEQQRLNGHVAEVILAIG